MKKNEKERRLESLWKWKGKFGFEAIHRKLVEVLLSLSVSEKVCHFLKGTVMLCIGGVQHRVEI